MSTVSKAVKIQSTKEYDLFKFGHANRNIDEKHVGNLMKSIRELNMTESYPILVTPDMEIFDGQHRFEACRRLNYPVYYTMVSVHDSDAMINVNYNVKKWTLLDFVHHEAGVGNEACKRVLEDCARHELTPTTLLRIVFSRRTGGNEGMAFVRHLNYNEEDSQRLDEFMDMLGTFRRLTFWRNTRFIEAFKTVTKQLGYDHKVMVKQFENYRTLLNKHTSREGFLDNLLMLYNYNRPKATRLRVQQDEDVA